MSSKLVTAVSALATPAPAPALHPRQAGHPSPSGRTHLSSPPSLRAWAPLDTSISLRGSLQARAGPHSRPSLVFSGGEIVEVEDLRGIRVVQEEGVPPRVEYLVQWKDGSEDTWEPATNLADDLLRDFEQRWWSAARKGDEEAMGKMLEGGGPVLARTVDEARRSALHFAAALNRPALVRRLLAEGAEVDLADKEGYTPLHMAAGYLHTSTITALLEGGADPEQEDRQGRSPLVLVESLRAALPADNPNLMSRRVALEDVLKVLTDNLFEDVDPAAVLDARQAEEDQAREFLVQFPDEEEPAWVAAKYVSEEVAADFDAGLEYCEAESVVDVRNRGDSRTYLVRWGDGYPDSWEPEEHVSPDLVRLFEEGRAGAAAEGAGEARTPQVATA